MLHGRPRLRGRRRVHVHGARRDRPRGDGHGRRHRRARRPPQAAPVAHDDQVSTRRGTKVTFDVLANDAGTPPLIVDDVTQPAHGTATCSPAGQCSYEPEAGFSGNDGFRYTIKNSDDLRSTAEVHVTVAPPSAAFGASVSGSPDPLTSGNAASWGVGVTGVPAGRGRRRARRARAPVGHGHADRRAHDQAGLGHDCAGLERRPGHGRLGQRARRLERDARRGGHAAARQAAAAHQPGHRRRRLRADPRRLEGLRLLPPLVSDVGDVHRSHDGQPLPRLSDPART